MFTHYTLQHQFEPGEETPRAAWTVHIAGSPTRTSVEILLECICDVLYPGIELQRGLLVEAEGRACQHLGETHACGGIQVLIGSMDRF